MNELFPKVENKGLKSAHDERMDSLRLNTPPGMAHWSGTGPNGTKCVSCQAAVFHGYTGNGEFSALKPINCSKYKFMTKRVGPGFDPFKASCRFYIEGSGPPKK